VKARLTSYNARVASLNRVPQTVASAASKRDPSWMMPGDKGFRATSAGRRRGLRVGWVLELVADLVEQCGVRVQALRVPAIGRPELRFDDTRHDDAEGRHRVAEEADRRERRVEHGLRWSAGLLVALLVLCAASAALGTSASAARTVGLKVQDRSHDNDNPDNQLYAHYQISGTGSQTRLPRNRWSSHVTTRW
jgi:hypothetical protein